MYKVIFICVITVLNPSFSKRFPSYISKCHQKDPEIKQCYFQVLNQMKDYFRSGIPEFKIPPLAPLQISEISLQDNQNFNAKFQNLTIYDLEHLQVKNVDVDLEANKIFVHLFLPTLTINTNYKIEGKLLFFNLHGSGVANGNFSEVTVDAEILGYRYRKTKKEHVKLVAINFEEKIKKANFYFNDLFANNPELTQQTNKIVNENIMDIINDLKPSIHDAVQQTVLGLIGNVFDKFSLQELFPE